MAGKWPKGTNVVAIVPAYHETKFIENIVRELKEQKSGGLIQEIIVVDDGSTDKTAEIAKKAGADKVIRLEKNRGKMAAFAKGLKYVENKYAPRKGFQSEKARLKKMDSTIVLSIDADLKEVTKRQVIQLAKPIVKSRKIDMVIGNTGGLTELSGQRAVRLRALGGLLRQTIMWRTQQETGYFQEIALNRLMKGRTKNAKTDFREQKAGSERYSSARQIKLVSEWNAGKRYLDWRKKDSKKIRKERKMLALQCLEKRQRHRKTSEILERHRQYEKHVAEKALRQMRRKLRIIK